MANGVLLVRHGEPDYEAVRSMGPGSSARNVAPLSDVGRRQALDRGRHLDGVRPVRIVASPMTRTLQTAALIAQAASVECRVDVDLREWDSGTDGSPAAFETAAAAFRRAGGERVAGEPGAWESLHELRSRASAAVERWSSRDGVVVLVTHAFVIEALTGRDGRTIGFCEVASIEARGPDRPSGVRPA